MRKGAKRKILTAGLGVAAFTALEGLACGNPVAPACPTYNSCHREPEVLTSFDAAPATEAAIDAGVPDAAPTP